MAALKVRDMTALDRTDRSASGPPRPPGRLHLGRGWTADRVAAAFIAAILPPLAVAIHRRGAELCVELAVAAAATFVWQFVFARMRGSMIGWDGLVAAASFAVLLNGAPLWQIALAMSFGVVIGEQVFGGRGFAFLNPAVVALAFLFFSFPSGMRGGTDLAVGLASIPGGLLLIFLNLISWRIAAAAVAAFVTAAAVIGGFGTSSLMASGGLIFGLVFLGCDPAAAAVTGPGRVVYGAIVGLLVAIFGPSENYAIVFAVLLASLAAPAMDHAVMRLHVRRRRRRHG